MLEQILNDMYVEPELLAELDEEQKQILFCKMREEQIRKWKIRDEQMKEEDYVRKSTEGGKKVSFLMGGDGDPVVVVLGGDEDVDALLQERAKRQAEMEGDALRKAAEEELDKLVRLSQSTVKEMERNAHRNIHTTKICDPTRDAVVRSLQEATQEMEKEMRALELQEKEGLPQMNPSLSCSTPSLKVAFENLKPVKDSLNADKKTSLSSKSLSSCLSSSGNYEREEEMKEEERREEEESKEENFIFNSSFSSVRPHISVAPYASQRTTLTPFGVAAQIEQFERLSESSLLALKTATLERAKNRRQKEILDNLRHQVEAAKSEGKGSVVVAAEREESAWREQERKAKEAERRIRDIARRAREEHRRTSSSSAPENMSEVNHVIDVHSDGDPFFNGDINGNIKAEDFSNNNAPFTSPPLALNNVMNETPSLARPRLRPFRPPSKKEVVDWFKEEEIIKGVGLNRSKNQIEQWFHGIISRTEAERILENSSIGSFLVRVSERIWGYAVSYKAADRCRHYLIDAMGGSYAFLGSHQNTHLSLANLIEYHKKEYITASGREILDKPCGQVDPSRPDYGELFYGTCYASLLYSK